MPLLRVGPSCAHHSCGGPVWDSRSGLCSRCWHGRGRPGHRHPATLDALALMPRDWDAAFSRLTDWLPG